MTKYVVKFEKLRVAALLGVVVIATVVVGINHQGVVLGVVVFTSSNVSFIMFIRGNGPVVYRNKRRTAAMSLSETRMVIEYNTININRDM